MVEARGEEGLHVLGVGVPRRGVELLGVLCDEEVEHHVAETRRTARWFFRGCHFVDPREVTRREHESSVAEDAPVFAHEVGRAEPVVGGDKRGSLHHPPVALDPTDDAVGVHEREDLAREALRLPVVGELRGNGRRRIDGREVARLMKDHASRADAAAVVCDREAVAPLRITETRDEALARPPPRERRKGPELVHPVSEEEVLVLHTRSVL